MNHIELCDLLHDKGFDSDWTLEGETLTFWGHDGDPASPLPRPEATDESSSPD